MMYGIVDTCDEIDINNGYIRESTHTTKSFFHLFIIYSMTKLVTLNMKSTY